MLRPSLLALVLATALATSGCYLDHLREGGARPASDGGPISRAEPLTPRDFVEQVVLTWCEELRSCPTSGGGDPIARADIDICLTTSSTALALRASLEAYVDAVDEGRATFDPSAVPACLAEIARTECVGRSGIIHPPPPHAFSIGEPGLVASSAACDAVWPRVLARAEGEACDGPLDCALGLHCAAMPGIDACARRCAPLARGGEPCSGGGLCAGASGDLLCIDGACSAPIEPIDVSAGEPCGWVDPPRRARCAPGLACVGGVDAVCRAIETTPLAECPVSSFFGEGCGDGLTCPSRAGYRCLPSELRTRVGDWCSLRGDSNALLVCDPRAGLVCDIDERDEPRCRARSAGREGETCDHDGYEPCGAGLRCSDARCVRARPAGSACEGPWDCTSGWCEEGVCQACEPDAAPIFYAR